MALSIVVATLLGLPSLGVPVTGKIPEGLPASGYRRFGLLEFDELFPLAAGCVLLAYIEGVSAARSFAAKHGYALDVRQEFLGLGAANLAAAFGHGYPVAGGLSQSAVNDKAGARTPLALVICSVTLALCLLFFTGLLTNLPKAVLAAIVFAAVYRLVDIRALLRMWRVSRIDFYAAAIALVSVLLLGILQGVLLAPLRRSSCCWRGPRSRTSRSSAGSPEPAAIPTARGMRASSRWSASSRSAPKPRCSTSMPKRSWRRC